MLGREFSLSLFLPLSYLYNYIILIFFPSPLPSSHLPNLRKTLLCPPSFLFFFLLLVVTCGHVPVEGGEMLWCSYSESYNHDLWSLTFYTALLSSGYLIEMSELPRWEYRHLLTQCLVLFGWLKWDRILILMLIQPTPTPPDAPSPGGGSFRNIIRFASYPTKAIRQLQWTGARQADCSDPMIIVLHM